MTGLSFIAGFLVYLFITAIVINLVSGWAKKRGRSPKKWGLVAFLIMYHLVFWDFIPTYVVYKYYCITKAGFWVYKTPEQWKAENPGVAETLTWRDMSPDYRATGVTRGYQLNERIAWVIKENKGSIIPVGISEESIVDLGNNESLVTQISVWSGYSGGKGFVKFWTNWPSYMPSYKNFGEYETQYKKLGRKVK